MSEPAIVLPVRAEAVHVFESGLCTYDVLDANGKFVCEANDEQTAAELVRMLNERTEMLALNEELTAIVHRACDKRDEYEHALERILVRAAAQPIHVCEVAKFDLATIADDARRTLANPTGDKS